LAAMVVLMGASSVAMAADGASKVKFVGAVGLGGAVKGDGFTSDYSSGAGLDGNLGLQFDENLSVLLEINSYIFQTTFSGVYSAEVNFIPTLKYAFGQSKTKFYLLGGLGVNVNELVVSTDAGNATLSQSNFAIEPGAGIQFPLNDALDLYLQAEFVDVFANSTFSYVPISVGLDFM